ncbi:INO80 complex subunit B-like [Sycon ciliatum]|uniref:INO80 complex subunit B-like n=1 Tax=Sycon ciliatum TaxID=27933 RepID=UPI0031F5FD2C
MLKLKVSKMAMIAVSHRVRSTRRVSTRNTRKVPMAATTVNATANATVNATEIAVNTRKRRRRKGTESRRQKGGPVASNSKSNLVDTQSQLQTQTGYCAFLQSCSVNGFLFLHSLAKSEIFTEEDDDETASDDGDIFELEENLVQEEHVGRKEKEEDGDEEQKWLAALEAGELDDSGQLRSERHKPLTARQRSLKQEQIGFQEELMELPMRRKEKEVTEEMLARRSELARKRRLKQQKEQEEIKKQTVKKLITKQSKKKDDEKETVTKRLAGPRVQYSSTADSIALSYPEGFQFPLASQRAREPPKPKLCAAQNCEKVKKYACSSNGLPVCSLACYNAVKDQPAMPSAMPAA